MASSNEAGGPSSEDRPPRLCSLFTYQRDRGLRRRHEFRLRAVAEELRRRRQLAQTHCREGRFGGISCLAFPTEDLRHAVEQAVGGPRTIFLPTRISPFR